MVTGYIGPGLHSCSGNASIPEVRNILVDGDSWTDDDVFAFPVWPQVMGIPTQGVGSSVIAAGSVTNSISTRILATDLTNVDLLIINGSANDLKNDLATGIGTIQTGYMNIKAHAAAQGVGQVVLLTPQPFGNFAGFGGVSAWTPAKEQRRQQLKAWMYTLTGCTIFDLDAVVASDGVSIDAIYDLGDGIHLSSAGNQALAAALQAAGFGI